MKRLTVFQLTALLVGLASAAAAWQGKDTKLPAPSQTVSSSNAPKVVARPDGAQLSLPKGFSVDTYAEGFEKPRFMALGPSGEVLVSDSVENSTSNWSTWLLSSLMSESMPSDVWLVARLETMFLVFKMGLPDQVDGVGVSEYPRDTVRPPRPRLRKHLARQCH